MRGPARSACATADPVRRGTRAPARAGGTEERGAHAAGNGGIETRLFGLQAFFEFDEVCESRVMSGDDERDGEALLRRTMERVQRSSAGVIDFFAGGDFVVGFDVGLVARCGAEVSLKVRRILAEIMPKPSDFSLFVATKRRRGICGTSGDFVKMFVEGVHGAIGTRMGKGHFRHARRCVNRHGGESNPHHATRDRVGPNRHLREMQT